VTTGKCPLSFWHNTAVRVITSATSSKLVLTALTDR